MGETEAMEGEDPGSVMMEGLGGRIRAVDVMLILAEHRADIRRVVESTARIETGQSDLVRRVSAVEVDLASMKATQTAMQQHEEQSVSPRTSPWVVASVLVAAAAVILSLVLDAYKA